VTERAGLILESEGREIARAVARVKGLPVGSEEAYQEWATAGNPVSYVSIVFKNDSGGVLEPFDVIRVSRDGEIEFRGVTAAETSSGSGSGSTSEAGDGADVKTRSAVWVAEVPDSELTGQYAVVQTKTQIGERGRAILIGVTKVRLNDENEADYADPIPGSVEKMETVRSGRFSVLAVSNPGSTDTWGYVLLAPKASQKLNGSYAKITGHAGTAPPYLYTAQEVTHDGTSSFTPANFTVVTENADDLSWNLVNLTEIGGGGNGLAPLEDGTIVRYWPLNSRYYAAEAMVYKGTYL